MAKDKTIQSEVSSFISTFLRAHFGKGPTSVYVTIEQPFIVLHLRGFLTPMEENLLNQNESKRVIGTRALILNDLKKELIQNLADISGFVIQDLYIDWNIQAKTGVIWGVMEGEAKEGVGEWPNQLSKESFVKKINQASRKSEKVPLRTEAYWLNNRIILVRRTGSLLAIEKEFIKNGFVEELKMSKHPLEQRVLEAAEIETVLNCKVSEIFMDWNFGADIGYLIFVLEP